MGVKKDAGKLMLYVYGRYDSPGARELDVSQKGLADFMKWNEDRTGKALKFLDKLGLIDLVYTGTGTVVSGVKAKGMSTVENKEAFKMAFGFEGD